MATFFMAQRRQAFNASKTRKKEFKEGYSDLYADVSAFWNFVVSNCLRALTKSHWVRPKPNRGCSLH
jgi:hypothetical protein